MKHLSRLAALAVALASPILFGQSTSISGVVTDPTGAVIPGARVAVENTATGLKRQELSDNQGRYTFPQLNPGTYKLSAQSAGFNDVIVQGIQLQVNSPASLNVIFEKLSSTKGEVVMVEGGAIQVNTTDATLGNAIGSQAIIEVPLFARNVAGLLAFQAGVTQFGSNLQPTDDRNGAVNGGKSDQANVTLDGLDSNDQNGRTAFTSVLRVSPEAIEQFRTTTINANADQGRSSGAQISLITKSGTNEYHGSLYEYHRNTITSANDFFNNSSGVPRPALLINVFGGSLGGKLPMSRNRAFFFLNYEGRRDASATNVQRVVPSDLLRQGIVQYTDPSNPGKLLQVGPDVIKNMIDPLKIGPSVAALKIFNLYPKGNDTSLGDGINFIGNRFTAPVRGDQNTYTARFDWNIDQGGKHMLFWRGNLQNDSSNGVPQFAGGQPNSVILANNKGYGINYTAIIRPNLISTTRYGLTRAGGETTGVQSTPAVTFRNLNSIYGISTGVSRIIPVHNITQDFVWTRGAHEVKLGGVMRFISNQSDNYANTYNSASTNASWLRGTGSDVTPKYVPQKDSLTFADAMVALLGVVSQGTGNFHYDVAGNLFAQGQPVKRNFANQEYEWYIQDTWKLRRDLTLSIGLRHSLMPAVYEANGQQISSTIPLNDFFNKRQGLADKGLSQAGVGSISYVLANGPGGSQLYPDQMKNFAPRFALAYSPSSDSGIRKFLFGEKGKSSFRVGWGMFYDLFGQPLTGTGDASAFGLASSLTNPAGQLTSATAPRFTDFATVPTQLVRAAPKGGFPVAQPNNFAITNSIDNAIRAPYTMNSNVSFSREFGKGWLVQASYVGRQSRRSLINRDLAMPTNPTDPKSGQTYFQAATQMMQYLLNKPSNVSTPNWIGAMPKIPYFENLWTNAAYPKLGLSATQVIAADASYNEFPVDFTSTLADIDQYCDSSGTSFAGSTIDTIDTVGCSNQGPNFQYSSQFSSLSGWSSVGGGSYHSGQLTIRKRFSQGLLMDLNYTLGKSIDLGSRSEGAGSFSGFAVNPYNLSQLKAVSNYDTKHLFNAYFVYDIPVGRGKKFGSSMTKLGDLLVGGWQLSGTWAQSSGLPTSPGNGRRWPTNWNITGFATPNGLPIPEVTNDKNAKPVGGKGGPNLWSDASAALAAFQFTSPGQTGTRNTIRGDGQFAINSGLSKRFIMPYSEKHSMQLRWETFNVTNTVRFDPASANHSLTSGTNWGKLSGILNRPREMQFALRYDF